MVETNHEPMRGGGAGPWVMRMSWHDVLFAHWAVPAERLRAAVPAGLTIEEYDGTAWLGVVPFYMSGVRPRALPPVPTTGAFAEINVRTYVTDGESRGVWFFSLDAESWLAVQAARRTFHLNYYYARMRYEPGRASEGGAGGWVDYRSDRVGEQVGFEGRYRGVGGVWRSEAGSLEAFLTERYCLFAAAPDGRIWRGDIAHVPWPLRRAEAELGRNTMAGPLGVELRGEPHLLYADRVDVHAWRPVRVAGDGG